MKKLFGLTIIFGSLFIGNSAMAEETQTTSVNYDMPSSYTVTIPSKISLDSENSVGFTIWDYANIKKTENLEIRVSEGISDVGEIILKRSNAKDTLTTSLYRKKLGSMTEDRLITKSDNLLATRVGAGRSDNGSIGTGTPMLLSAPSGNQLAGSYSATLTFQAELIDVSE